MINIGRYYNLIQAFNKDKNEAQRLIHARQFSESTPGKDWFLNTELGKNLKIKAKDIIGTVDQTFLNNSIANTNNLVNEISNNVREEIGVREEYWPFALPDRDS